MSLNVYMIVDRSGSMSNLVGEAVSAINAYAEGVSGARFYLASFDGNGYDVLRDLHEDVWRPLTINEVSPRGSTPLWDAAGTMLDKALLDNPRKAVIVVMTDGHENCSTKFTQSQVKQKLARAETRGYQVVFLGANFDKVTEDAARVGAAWDRTVNFAQGKMEMGTRSLASKSMMYATTGAAIGFNEAERTELSGPTGAQPAVPSPLTNGVAHFGNLFVDPANFQVGVHTPKKDNNA